MNKEAVMEIIKKLIFEDEVNVLINGNETAKCTGVSMAFFEEPSLTFFNRTRGHFAIGVSELNSIEVL